MSSSRVIALFLPALIMLLTSCVVSRKKFDEMLAQKIRTEAELLEKSDQLTDTRERRDSLDAKTRKLAQDTARLYSSISGLNDRYRGLQSDYNQLNGTYKNLLNSSGKLNRDLSQQREQLLVIQDNLDRTRRKNDSLNVSLAEREKKVKELEGVLADKDKAVRKLKDQISAALLSFKESDLTVKVKNGKVYVSLAEQLLFQSGSTVVDAKGVTALQQLAKALRDQSGIQIMVEGHTDNDSFLKPIEHMNDNWDLSVLRATAITRILTKSGLSPTQITASGKGEFNPLVGNDSKENKRRNRRTEIIITPQLDELFRLLDSN